jgi:hypothetical protein
LLLTAALRAPFLNWPLGADEGGYLYVARQWTLSGHWLYGNQWVDRPPALILVFKLCALLGGTPVAVRMVGVLLAAVLVASAWWAGRTVAGRAGAVAAALVAAALASNPFILGNAVISDNIAATFVMASCALVLAAVDDRDGHLRRALLFAVGAGALAAVAFLTKQNALLGGVVAFVVLVARPRRHWPLLLAYAAGAAVPLLATVVWAVTGPGLAMLVNAIYTFRAAAAQLVWASPFDAPARRAHEMVWFLIQSGLAVVVLGVAVDLVLRRRRRVLRLTIVLGAAYLVVSVALSLNWYSYYLLACTPLAALGIALVFAPGPRRGTFALLPRLVVVATVALAVVGAVLARPPRLDEVSIEDYISARALPTDSMVVAFGQPNIIEASGLRTPYPYSWSLPVRVEDPKLHLLARTLDGPHAPTWIVQLGSFSEWGLGDTRLPKVIVSRYHLAGLVCGHLIYLHDGLQRPVRPPGGVASAGCTT